MATTQGQPDCQLTVTFVGRGLIRRLNRDYLGHDYVTDVISFSLSEPEERPLVGDIYVCVPRAEQQARWYGATPDEELVRLAAHGTLHVLGFDHERPQDEKRMSALQEACVEEFRRGSYGSVEHEA